MRSRYFCCKQGQSVGLGLAATCWLAVGAGAIAQPAPSFNPAQTLAQVPSQTASYLLFVNPSLGNDSNNGNQGTPLRTISRALQFIQDSHQANHQVNTVILLAPGTYSAETGEAFPLLLQPGITLQGDPASQGQGIVIRGGGSFLSPTSAQQNITMLAANGAVITGLTLTNPNPRGYGVWVESSSPTVVSNTFSSNTHDGISIVGNSAPLVQGNTFVQNGANGISIYGSARPQVRDNRFERTGYGINVAQTAAPVIINNHILNNRSGVVVQDHAQPILQGNTIERNREDGVVAIAHSLPNLGTVSAPGNNQFRDNGRYDINASSASQIISAAGNQLTSQRTTGRVDLSGSSANPSVASTSVVSAPAAPGAAAPLTPSAPARLSAPQTRPATATAATLPVAASLAASTRGTTASGFANFPSLQAASPAATTYPPAEPTPQTTSRPNSSERVLLQPAANPALSAAPATSTATSTSAPASAISASSFPNPTAITAPNAHPAIANRSLTPPLPRSTHQSISQPAAIEIPVLPSRTPTVSNQRPGDAPIEIPVQSPPTSASHRSEPLPQVAVQRSPQSAPIPPSPPSRNITPTSTPIPVVSPNASRPTPPPSSVAVASRAVAPVPQAHVLPVPGGDIPVGNIGDMPTVVVSQNPLQRLAYTPPSSNSVTALGLRYRVVIEAEDEGTQEWIRSMVPGAFRTYTDGRVMMQAGAYSDRTNADEAARQLTNSGLRAMVQPLQ